MTKVFFENTYTKEEIIIDPYIPIKVKFGNFYSWEDITHYLRFGDFKHSMLEIGYSAEKGIIHSIALVGVKNIFLNKVYNYKIENCEEGIIKFNVEEFAKKYTTDIKSELAIYTSNNEIIISLCADNATKFIQNGKVKFGLNQTCDLCCIIINCSNDAEMYKFNWCLESML